MFKGFSASIRKLSYEKAVKNQAEFVGGHQFWVKCLSVFCAQLVDLCT